MQALAGLLFYLLLGSDPNQLASPPPTVPPAPNCGYPDPPACFVPLGYFTTGVALADLNNDGFTDAVLANGNDVSPQPLVVYYGSAEGFGNWPDWYSDEIDFMGDLAIGDIDSDGWLDVAVAVLTGLDRNTGAGGVKVFVNHAGKLESAASYQTAGGYLTLGCTLGDVDADGDLDLIVPVIAEGATTLPSLYRLEVLPGLKDGRARIYLNRDGRLEESPSWIESKPSRAGDALVADINQDGWMDLAIAGSKTKIFYGKGPKVSSEPLFPEEPSWQSSNTHCYSYSVDAGRSGESGNEPATLPSHAALMVAVSSGCLGTNPKDCGQCNSRFLIYQPHGQTAPMWASNTVQFASKLLLADLDGNSYLDLVADQWATPAGGAPLSLYMGQQYKEPPFAEEPTCLLGQNRIGQGLAVADLRKHCMKEWTYEAEASETAAVVTLPHRRIQAIKAVIKEQEPLTTAEFSWTPESNWISLSQPLLQKETIQVIYYFSDCLDIAEGTFQPQHGSYIFYQGEAGKCSLSGIPGWE